MKKSKVMKLITLLMIFVFGISITAYAETETDAEETVEFVEEDLEYSLEDSDKYVSGIYNAGANARANLTGIIHLAKYDTKLVADYDTAYTKVVSRLGVKNVKLQYKGSLGIWYTLITLEDRYRENSNLYSGSFNTTGTYGRTYRLKATHYANVSSVSTETRANQTEELTFD